MSRVMVRGLSSSSVVMGWSVVVRWFWRGAMMVRWPMVMSWFWHFFWDFFIFFFFAIGALNWIDLLLFYSWDRLPNAFQPFEVFRRFKIVFQMINNITPCKSSQQTKRYKLHALHG